jgi:hypothetical protein
VIHATDVVLLSTRALVRELDGEAILDGAAAIREWGDEYRHRASKRVVVLRPIAEAAGAVLAALWVSGSSRDEACQWSREVLCVAQDSALLVRLSVEPDADGEPLVPRVEDTPSVLALWPESWRVRLPVDGPEWIDGPDAATMAPGAPPTGTPMIGDRLA